MDTNRLRRFAVEARSLLVSGVTQRFYGLGFDKEGQAKERPQLFEGGATFMGETVSTDFYDVWCSLEKAVDIKGIDSVIEEAAYTWFNRLIAIRILSKNGLIAPVLDYESSDVKVPVIVRDARQGRFPQMSEQSSKRLRILLDDDSKTNEQFRILVVSFCHSTPVIFKCFGSVADYTEMLLPANILSEGGFVDMLNNTEYLEEEDYTSPELIGWLYQYYISEKKDAVFASFSKGHKAGADEIPAATQIFTPNWIVKYMVQNTIGRIYLDNNPQSLINDDLEYLVKNEEDETDKVILKIDDLHDLTCADLACGSGHILNECFNILFKLYTEEGYSRRQTIEDIFKYNITGIDIDTRAKQLAVFALMLKACQKDQSFLDGHCIPNVLDMPIVDRYTFLDLNGHFQCAYQMSDENEFNADEIIDAFDLMKNDRELGSIMIFKISDKTRLYMQKCVEAYQQNPQFDIQFDALINAYKLILALTQKYAAVVMNPPYMGGANMDATLSEFVKNNYKEGKSDLCTAFILLEHNHTKTFGYYSNITPPSWVFLSSFEKFRKKILDENSISSLLHLSRGVFGADFGSVSAVFQNAQKENAKGTYFRLIDRTFQEFDQLHLKELFEKTLNNHDFRFLFSSYTKDCKKIEYAKEGAQIYYSNVEQHNFEKIPCFIFGYWLKESVRKLFLNPKLDTIGDSKQGVATANNSLFVRNWNEISISKFTTNYKCNPRKWVPYNKGGEKRRWYGNQYNVINWNNNGGDLYDYPGSVIRNPLYFFKESISWSLVCSGLNSFRLYPEGFVFDVAGMSYFPYNDNVKYILLGILNTKAYSKIAKIINPTINLQCGDVSRFPFLPVYSQYFEKLVIENVDIARQDWDAHETSWDFKETELIRMRDNCGENCMCVDMLMSINDADGFENVPTNGNLLSDCYKAYVGEWGRKFNQLRLNECRLNKEFIEIYGLQDELTPDVPLDEITILQQGEISIVNDEIVWHADAIIKQMLSYAVGCMMGRYSIDKPGLILANQGDGIDEYKNLVPDSRFEIDDDGIIPLMSSATEFTDAITLRFKSWLSTTFGADELVKNLNFIEECLGKPLDDYFVKDFWNDHKKMYQSKPIYWLFSSKKGAFQCLAYMHRMNPYTAEKIRTKYLLPHIEWLVAKSQEMESLSSELNLTERRELDLLYKQINECREYHDRLHVIADQQITFDLDDGVTVNYAKFGDILRKIK